ncbi:MAG: TrkH family potassium uptake protein, partial [Paracoccaceae bacterium]
MRTLTEFPLFVLLAMIGAAAMLVPALHAVQLEQWKIARTFLYHGIFFFMFASIIGVATMNRAPRLTAKAHLLTLFLSYLLFPAMLAAPVLQLVPSLAFGQGYFEMLANLTTTGGTVFERPGELAQPLQLWSALVGWMGGFLILMAALAVLEPMNLGGFEIRSVVMRSGSGTVRSTDASKEATERIIRVSRGLAGPYVVLTGVLALLLILLGDRPFVAVSHAMAVLATNGTSPVGGITGASSGIPGEMVVAVFLFFAVSHWLFRFDFSRDQIRALRRDPEIMLGVNSVVLVA